MDKKIILIGILAVFFIIGTVIYNVTNKEEEEFDYENIVQNINDVQEEVVEEKEYMKIHITGQVNNPGIIELEIGSRISDAIEKAGGLTGTANLDNVNLAYSLEDGQKLYIPSIEENNTVYIEEGIDEAIVETTSFSGSSKIININKASETELQEIPGIGPAMAQKIINYRDENGKFKTIEDIKNVSGIGDKKFENIKEYISVK